METLNKLGIKADVWILTIIQNSNKPIEFSTKLYPLYEKALKKAKEDCWQDIISDSIGGHSSHFCDEDFAQMQPNLVDINLYLTDKY